MEGDDSVLYYLFFYKYKKALQASDRRELAKVFMY